MKTQINFEEFEDSFWESNCLFDEYTEREAEKSLEEAFQDHLDEAQWNLLQEILTALKEKDRKLQKDIASRFVGNREALDKLQEWGFQFPEEYYR